MENAYREQEISCFPRSDQYHVRDPDNGTVELKAEMAPGLGHPAIVVNGHAYDGGFILYFTQQWTRTRHPVDVYIALHNRDWIIKGWIPLRRDVYYHQISSSLIQRAFDTRTLQCELFTFRHVHSNKAHDPTMIITPPT